ncbi:hypothetical protein D9757_003973 [Collybiopsis confluens]|uniref:CFEM domain-containing protein n=1 Tax=Collybiopsis confluens TaxID=2823264 RepID=A0A8H5HX13_9AGAR|nr:hypothetical protein D9757_003973 [Collybiopsis confluens]
MFSFSRFSLLVSLLPFAFAAPAANVEKRSEGATMCGLFDTALDGNYELFLNQWGASGATSGSDCASITSLSGNNIAWTTTWNWVGGNGVKSFTNIGLTAGINQKLSAISTIPSVWDWRQTTTGTIVADVAYDMFTSNTAAATTEIMVWLANINAGPISASFNAAGQPNPVASGISLAGHTWNLYSGSNGANAVFSFLPSTAGTQITSFSGDLMTFFTYLIQHEGLGSSQFLTTLQGGTEATMRVTDFVLTSIVAVSVSASASVFKRQQLSLPSCALTCLSSAITSSGCDTTDEKCLCTSSTFINSTSSCITKSCSDTDAATALKGAADLCASVSVTLDTSSIAASVTSPASSASTSATTTAAPSASSTASSDSARTNSALSGVLGLGRTSVSALAARTPMRLRNLFSTLVLSLPVFASAAPEARSRHGTKAVAKNPIVFHRQHRVQRLAQRDLIDICVKIDALVDGDALLKSLISTFFSIPTLDWIFSISSPRPRPSSIALLTSVGQFQHHAPCGTQAASADQNNCCSHKKHCPCAPSPPPPSPLKRRAVSFADAKAYCGDRSVCGVAPGSSSHQEFVCVDTRTSAENCGGCIYAHPWALTDVGSGIDCTKRSSPRALSQRCELSQCVVDVCAEGYIPSQDGSECVRPSRIVPRGLEPTADLLERDEECESSNGYASFVGPWQPSSTSASPGYGSRPSSTSPGYSSGPTPTTGQPIGSLSTYTSPGYGSQPSSTPGYGSEPCSETPGNGSGSGSSSSSEYGTQPSSSSPGYGTRPTSSSEHGGQPTSAPYGHGGTPSGHGGQPITSPAGGAQPSSSPGYGTHPWSSDPGHGSHPTTSPTGGTQPSSSPGYGSQPSSSPGYGAQPSSSPGYGYNPSTAGSGPTPTHSSPPSSSSGSGDPCPESGPSTGAPSSSSSSSPPDDIIVKVPGLATADVNLGSLNEPVTDIAQELGLGGIIYPGHVESVPAGKTPQGGLLSSLGLRRLFAQKRDDSSASGPNAHAYSGLAVRSDKDGLDVGDEISDLDLDLRAEDCDCEDGQGQSGSGNGASSPSSSGDSGAGTSSSQLPPDSSSPSSSSGTEEPCPNDGTTSGVAPAGSTPSSPDDDTIANVPGLTDTDVNLGSLNPTVIGLSNGLGLGGIVSGGHLESVPETNSGPSTGSDLLSGLRAESMVLRAEDCNCEDGDGTGQGQSSGNGASSTSSTSGNGSSSSSGSSGSSASCPAAGSSTGSSPDDIIADVPGLVKADVNLGSLNQPVIGLAKDLGLGGIIYGGHLESAPAS